MAERRLLMQKSLGKSRSTVNNSRQSGPVSAIIAVPRSWNETPESASNQTYQETMPLAYVRRQRVAFLRLMGLCLPILQPSWIFRRISPE